MNPLEFETLARTERDFWWFRGMEGILFGMLDRAVAGRAIHEVMEAGCGTGHMSVRLQERYGWRIFPADLSEHGLRYARSEGVRRLTRCDIRRLPFPDAAFDAVMCLDVLVHFAKGGEGEALAEFLRVLKPEGLLVVRASALNILRSRHSEFAWEQQRFSRERLLQALAQQGFRALRSTYANSLLMPVALAKFRVWEPLFARQPRSGTAPVPEWLNRLLEIPLNLERRLIGAGLNLPLGQSVIVIAEKPGEAPPVTPVRR
jgi:SAM-dependent methyltransferase